MNSDACEWPNRPTTPEHVLFVLRELQRCAALYDKALQDPINFATTVAGYSDVFLDDFPDWRRQARGLNELLGIDVDLSTWRDVLTPSRVRTLRDVCGLIASRATLPEIRPIRVLGRECLAASAFLLLRERLARRGVRVDHVAPSSSLSDFCCCGSAQRKALACEAIRLGLGRIAPMHVVNPGATVGLWVLLLSGSCALACGAAMGLGREAAVLGLIAATLFAALGYAICWISCPTHVEFGDLRTFRDLCYAIVGQAVPVRARAARL